MLRTPLIVLVLAAGVSAASEPVVSFTGVVRAFAVPDADFCAPTHELECSEGVFALVSTTLDLDDHLGQNVKLFGRLQPTLCPLYDIYDVFAVDDMPPATLVFCGTAGVGCPIRLRSGPGGMTQHFLLVSPFPGLLPTSPYRGSLLLGKPFLILDVQAGGIPMEGAAFDYTIPLDPQLIGLTAWFQAARRDIGPIGPLQLSNARCFTIVGFPFTCHDPDC